MRRYMTASYILLTHSVFHFALAAPVAVGAMLEVRFNAVDVSKDGIAALKKRMDFNNEDYKGSTNGAHRNNDPGSHSDGENNDAPGLGEVDMLESELPWESDETMSDARVPDKNYNGAQDPGFDFNGGGGYESDYGGYESSLSDGRYDSDFYGDHESDYGGSYEGNISGYEGDSDDDMHDDVQSLDGSTGRTSPGPESEHSASPEPEHPATPEPEHPVPPELMTDLERLLGSLRPRPRNSGSGALGTSKRELQENVGIKAPMVNARATSASSVIGSGAFTSVHDRPVHLQNRKKSILDQLD